MRTYEVMVIVDARLEEGDVQKAVDRITGVITEGGGTVSNVDRWGNRRFAYEIAHQHEGYYFIVTFEAPEAVVQLLNRTVQISDEFIRGKVVRPGDGVAAAPARSAQADRSATAAPAASRARS
jgi:small subunit ribosomal protein S6